MDMFYRTYAEIDLDALCHNMSVMRERTDKNAKLIGVMKADAYGHGAGPVARTISPWVSLYAVASAEEGLSLRKEGIEKPVLVLGPVHKSIYPELIRQDIRPAVASYRMAEELQTAALSVGKTAPFHLAVDTGMGRIGLFPEEYEEAGRIALLPGIRMEGIFTHFARADETDKASAVRQYESFLEFVKKAKECGASPEMVHCGNTAAILDLPHTALNAMRAGIGIYGLYPSDEVDKSIGLRPVMSLKSHITQVRNLQAGQSVSYGGTFTADRTMRIATVSCGYADGMPRGLSGKGRVLIHGKSARILGRVCMDQFMADVTGIPEAAPEDVVTIIGRDGTEEITMEETARISGRFHYEIPCLITPRVPRIYVKKGERR